MPALACALLVLQVAKGMGKVVALMALVGIGATVARSGSRGGLIGLVAVGVGAAPLGRGASRRQAGHHDRRGRRRPAQSGVLQGTGRQMESILRARRRTTTTPPRTAARKSPSGAWATCASRPLFGLGIDNFEKAECTISEKARNTPAGHGIRCMPPHNSFVQAGAELGVPGLLLWSSIPLFGIFALHTAGERLPVSLAPGHARRTFPRLACPYLAVACVGFTATCFFLNFAWLEPYYVLAAFVASLMGVIAQRRVEEQRMAHREAALAGDPVDREAAASSSPVPMLPGQARYPRPLRHAPDSRLRPGDLSSW